MAPATVDRVLKSYDEGMHTDYLRMCRTPDRKRVVGAWWLYEEVNNRFPLNKGWEPPDTPSPPLHEIRSVPSKGRGLFAARDIKQNDVIVRERPIFLAPKAHSGVEGNQWLYSDQNLLQLLYWLEQEDRDKLVQLHNCWSLDECGPITGILRTNGLRASFPGASICDSYGAICLIMSYANHDCSSNAGWKFDPETAVMTLYAKRNISADEEITISYTDSSTSLVERRRELKLSYDFICACTRCSSPTTEERSERRRFVDFKPQLGLVALFSSVPSWRKHAVGRRDIRLMELIIHMLDEENLNGNRILPLTHIGFMCSVLGDVEKFKETAIEILVILAPRRGKESVDPKMYEMWLRWFADPTSHVMWNKWRL